MKKIYCFLLLLSIVAAFAKKANAQSDTLKPVKVAVFIPLYADGVFDTLSYNADKPSLPKTILPGLEFYNGVMMAIDSLNQVGAKVEISIYDTKQAHQSLVELMKKPELNDVGLIIAAITNTKELKIFSDNALAKNIPLISATYPNYVGVSQNPYFVLLNSSFPAHLDGLYKHMKQYYSSNTILAVTKKGPTEDYIKRFITDKNKTPGAVPLKIKWINIDANNVNLANLKNSLDSTKNNVVFVASPLESFGLDVVEMLSSNESYQTTAIGMPTWDGMKDLDKPECKNVDIVFSTPFLYYSQNLGLSAWVNKRYKEKYYSRPSDMVFKGYEITYHFTRLLNKHRDSLPKNLNDKDFTLFNEFKLEPVRLRNSSPKPDFLENKKLYFIKKQAGTVKSII
ncbi:ABC transporter substrate-binding protein [Segetibacter koreensis]|uniref:ABC transporter substrate-binding protein n=1 Tax=Segetibacter koreensis TaxID=398037 RepID=UPI0003A01021|nr:ABC transporter substrate-binding protein [Segetibacter koreensis]